MVVRNTHPEEIMVRDVHSPQCNEAYTTIQLPASASRKGTASLCIKVDTRAGGNVLPLHVFTRSDQSSWSTHWPRPHQYQTHCLQWIQYTPIWCTLRTHHLAARLPWCSTPQGKVVLVCCGHPWSSHPGSTLKWETGSCEDELCHHHQATQHTSCTCFHYSGQNQACYSPWSSQVHQAHWWLDQGVPTLVQRHWPIPQQIQNPTPSWCTSHDTCP